MYNLLMSYSPSMVADICCCWGPLLQNSITLHCDVRLKVASDMMTVLLQVQSVTFTSYSSSDEHKTRPGLQNNGHSSSSLSPLGLVNFHERKKSSFSAGFFVIHWTVTGSEGQVFCSITERQTEGEVDNRIRTKMENFSTLANLLAISYNYYRANWPLSAQPLLSQTSATVVFRIITIRKTDENMIDGGRARRGECARS